MSEFVCKKVRKETGINWCIESREYELTRKWWQRFSKIHASFVVEETGEFHFPKPNSQLPQEGNSNIGYGLGPFIGKKYIDWTLKNTSGRVRLYCKRDYGLSDFGGHDIHEIVLSFADEVDAMAFKLEWM